MKFTHMIAAAGLMVAGLGMSTTAASAQGYRDYRGYDQRYDHRDDRRFDRYDDRRYDRRDRGRHYGWDRGRRYGWGNRGRACHSEWRHGRRVTVCYR